MQKRYPHPAPYYSCAEGCGASVCEPGKKCPSCASEYPEWDSVFYRWGWRFLESIDRVKWGKVFQILFIVGIITLLVMSFCSAYSTYRQING